MVDEFSRINNDGTITIYEEADTKKKQWT